MKNFLTISLIVLYINSNTEFHELLRLPMLLEHYTEHQQQTENLSFWNYLVMHYKGDKASDEGDRKLPFKNPAHSFVTPSFTLMSQKIILRKIAPVTEILHSSIYKEAFVASPLSEIFQPPRLS